MILLSLLSLLCGTAGGLKAQTVEGTTGTAVPVTVTTVESRDVPVWLSGIGSVEPLNRVVVRPRVDGQLDSVAFTEGQDVHQGDVIAQIDPRMYGAALDQALAKQAQDAASLANARADLARYQKLAASAFASLQQADTQKTAVAQLEAQIQQDAAAVAIARLQLDFTTIRAPLDGRIGLRQLDPGSIVHANDAAGLATVTQMAPIGALFSLPQDNLPDIRAAMAGGGVSVEAFSRDDMTRLARGRLVYVDSQVDPATGQIKLKAEFDNAKRELWPGQFIAVRLLLRTIAHATVVASQAIERSEDGQYVFRVEPDDTVVLRPITVAFRSGPLAVIAGGVSPGERVVLGGQFRLRPGMRVAPRLAAAAASSSGVSTAGLGQ